MDDRTRRTALVVGGVGVLLFLCLLMAGGAAWYWYYTRSPKYSLAQAKKAADAHDLATFEKYVDVRGVSRSIVDQAYREAQRGQKPPDSDMERTGRAIGEGLVALVKPRLAEELAVQISKAVESGTPPSTTAGRGGFSLGGVLSGLRTDLHFEAFEYERRSGSVANVGVLVRNPKNEEILLDLKMRDLGGYWQVAEITNVGDIIRANAPAP